MSNIRPILSSTGLQIKDTAEIKAAIEQIFKDALGQNMSTAPETPQGQLIASLTAIVQDKDAQILKLYNNFNPATASGIFQDALGSIYMLERDPAMPSYVMLECRGLPGVYLPGKNAPLGSAFAQSQNGELFVCSSGGTISEDGTVTLQFESVKTGAVSVPANSINRIYEVIPGWDSCNNPVAGIVGRDIESRTAFELRRVNSLALNSTGSTAAVYSSVAAADNVSHCLVRENVTSTPQNIGSVILVAHSIYVCVAGGLDEDIAQAIFNKKSAGCDTNGDNVMQIVDQITGATYTIKFQRPVIRPVQVLVNIRSGLPDPLNTAKKAVLSAFNGTDGQHATVTIGDTLDAGRFYCSLSSTGLRVVSVQVADRLGTWADTLTTEINQIATLSEDDILVHIL